MFVDEERFTGRDADSLRGEIDECGPFVVHVSPHVDSIGSGGVNPGFFEDLDDTSSSIGVFVTCTIERGQRVGIVEQFEKNGLEDSAAPTGSEHASVGGGGDDVAGTGHGGQSKIGSVALRKTANVHGSCGEVSSDADRFTHGDVARMIVFHDDDARRDRTRFDQSCNLVRASRRHRDPGGILRAWLQEERRR